MRQVEDALTSIAMQTMAAMVTPCDLARSCPSAGVSNSKSCHAVCHAGFTDRSLVLAGDVRHVEDVLTKAAIHPK